mmetsp:Transcript_8505/g.21340  ORF Transcript_8505/g.21340 Transcript_8505/m.21340 type:complete len:293 (-) Transcript_8505:2160-3038(-)
MREPEVPQIRRPRRAHHLPVLPPPYQDEVPDHRLLGVLGKRQHNGVFEGGVVVRRGLHREEPGVGGAARVVLADRGGRAVHGAAADQVPVGGGRVGLGHRGVGDPADALQHVLHPSHTDLHPWNDHAVVVVPHTDWATQLRDSSCRGTGDFRRHPRQLEAHRTAEPLPHQGIQVGVVQARPILEEVAVLQVGPGGGNVPLGGEPGTICPGDVIRGGRHFSPHQAVGGRHRDILQDRRGEDLRGEIGSAGPSVVPASTAERRRGLAVHLALRALGQGALVLRADHPADTSERS